MKRYFECFSYFSYLATTVGLPISLILFVNVFAPIRLVENLTTQLFLDTFRGSHFIEMLCLILKKRSTLNGSEFFPFRVDPLFRWALVCRKAYRKALKIVSLRKTVENVLSGYPGNATTTKHRITEALEEGKMRKKKRQTNATYETTDAQRRTAMYRVKPQWLEHLWVHGNLFETWVVRATED